MSEERCRRAMGAKVSRWTWTQRELCERASPCKNFSQTLPTNYYVMQHNLQNYIFISFFGGGALAVSIFFYFLRRRRFPSRSFSFECSFILLLLEHRKVPIQSKWKPNGERCTMNELFTLFTITLYQSIYSHERVCTSPTLRSFHYYFEIIIYLRIVQRQLQWRRLFIFYCLCMSHVVNDSGMKKERNEFYHFNCVR